MTTDLLQIFASVPGQALAGPTDGAMAEMQVNSFEPASQALVTELLDLVKRRDPPRAALANAAVLLIGMAAAEVPHVTGEQPHGLTMARLGLVCAICCGGLTYAKTLLRTAAAPASAKGPWG